MHIEKIIGPPGTGKTETLIRRIEAELAAGIAPSRLGYYSFTRAAALVARRRAMDAFSCYSMDDFTHYRTLHSEAFHLLGWSRDAVMTGKPLRQFSRVFGYDLSEAEAGPEERPIVVLRKSRGMYWELPQWQSPGQPRDRIGIV